MKYELIILFILTLLSCSSDDTNVINSSDLKGKWIEVGTRMDTLFFESWENFDIMNLYRGKEIRNGHLLPKSGSGSYEYKLAEESISLHWMLSSEMNFNNYYFNLEGNRLNIENFYGSPLGETLTFEKLE